MSRIHGQFQFQLSDTIAPFSCAKCTNSIEALEDSNHVTIYSATGSTWKLHVICFEDVIIGAMEFYKIFIIGKRKKTVQN